MQYFFDSFVLDTALRELSAGDETVRIEPKVFELLLHLLENRHRAVSKDELVAAVWDGRFISEAALSSAVRQMFTTIYMPDAPAESQTWFTDLQKKTTSPHNAAEILLAHGDVDVSGLLPHIRTPTLVMSARNDIGVPYAEGQELAAGIKEARFVTLDSANHVLPVTDPAWPRCIRLMHDFLKD